MASLLRVIFLAPLTAHLCPEMIGAEQTHKKDTDNVAPG